MPGGTPATSQLDWLSSTTAMIVLSWSKATRDLLKSFSWGIGALRQLFASDDGAISFAACPIPSLCWREMDSTQRSLSRASRFILRKVNCAGIDGAAKKTWRGTDGSNPSPSSGESGANSIPGSWLAPTGSGPEDVRVFNLMVLAQFVWPVSSAAIPARRPQVVAPPDRMPRPYR